jgi:hypothetical protein
MRSVLGMWTVPIPVQLPSEGSWRFHRLGVHIKRSSLQPTVQPSLVWPSQNALVILLI